MTRYELRNYIPDIVIIESESGGWVRYSDHMKERSETVVSMDKIRATQCERLTYWYDRERKAHKNSYAANKRLVIFLSAAVVIIIILGIELFSK